MQSDAPDIDIDLYADVMDSQLSLHFDDSDLFDDVVTATSDLNDENSLNTSPAEDPKDNKKNSTHVREQSNDTQFPTSPTNKQHYRIVIGNISWFSTDEDVTNALVEAGVNKEDILEIKFYENRANGQSRGYCYVGFRSSTAVQFLMPLKLKEIKGNIPSIMPFNKGIISNLEASSFAKSRPSFGSNAAFNQVGSNNFAPPAAVQKPPMGMNMNAPNAGNNFRQHINTGPRFPPRGPPNNFRPPIAQDNYNYRNPFPRGPGPAVPNCPPQNYPPNYQAGPSVPFCQGPPPGYFRGPNPRPNMMPPRDWNGPPMIHNNFPTRDQPTTPQRNIPPFIPNDGSIGHRPGPMIEPAPISITAHVNPAFFSPGSPGVLNTSPSSTGSPSSTLLNGKCNFRDDKNKDRSIHSIRRILSNNGVTGMTHEEFEDQVSRNRVVFTSAIARAVSDATAGEYLSGAETINTAIKLISESRVSHDERCQAIVDSLCDTLRALEESGKVDSRRSNNRKSSSRERERIRQRSARSRTRSRSRDRRNDSYSYRNRRRSFERDYYPDRSRTNNSRDRSRDRDRPKFQEDRDRDRERRSYSRRFCERTDFRERDGGVGGGPDQPQLD